MNTTAVPSSAVRAAVVFLSLAAVAVAPAAAQQPRAARALPAHNAELEEPWTGPLQLVELRNGSILVHDGREKRMAVANFATQEQREVSKEGGGPTEYRSDRDVDDALAIPCRRWTCSSSGCWCSIPAGRRLARARCPVPVTRWR